MSGCLILICDDVRMRTTLMIDAAIAKALQDLAHRSNQPFKQVVNETLRAGLCAPAVRKSRYKVKPAALGGVSPASTWIRRSRSPTHRASGALEQDAAAPVNPGRQTVGPAPRRLAQPVEVVGLAEASTGAAKDSPS